MVVKCQTHSFVIFISDHSLLLVIQLYQIYKLHFVDHTISPLSALQWRYESCRSTMSLSDPTVHILTIWNDRFRMSCNLSVHLFFPRNNCLVVLQFFFTKTQVQYLSMIVYFLRAYNQIQKLYEFVFIAHQQVPHFQRLSLQAKL